MNTRSNKTWVFVCSALLGSMYLTGCSDSNPAAAASYEVTVVNATNNQPLSPLTIITHDASYSVWTVGNTASTDGFSLSLSKY